VPLSSTRGATASGPLSPAVCATSAVVYQN
jgi:hypothetical protein